MPPEVPTHAPPPTCATPDCTGTPLPGQAYCTACLAEQLFPPQSRRRDPRPAEDAIVLDVRTLDELRAETSFLKDIIVAQNEVIRRQAATIDQQRAALEQFEADVAHLNADLAFAESRLGTLERQCAGLAQFTLDDDDEVDRHWLETAPGEAWPRECGYALVWGRIDPATGQVEAWRWSRVDSEQ